MTHLGSLTKPSTARGPGSSPTSIDAQLWHTRVVGRSITGPPMRSLSSNAYCAMSNASSGEAGSSTGIRA